MRVGWYEQSQTDVPDDTVWLSEWERLHVARLHVPKRRTDWLLGRWTAKRALAEALSLGDTPEVLARIEVWPAVSGAPQAFVDGSPIPFSISLSHAGGHAACMVGPADLAVGCDLEVVEPRSEAFVADYLTGEEQEALRQAAANRRTETLAAIWSAKESFLKALHLGLRVDTRCLPIFLDDQLAISHSEVQLETPFSRENFQWYAFSVRYERSPLRFGLWSRYGNLVRTLVWLPSHNSKH